MANRIDDLLAGVLAYLQDDTATPAISTEFATIKTYLPSEAALKQTALMPILAVHVLSVTDVLARMPKGRDVSYSLAFDVLYSVSSDNETDEQKEALRLADLVHQKIQNDPSLGSTSNLMVAGAVTDGGWGDEPLEQLLGALGVLGWRWTVPARELPNPT